MRVVIVGAGPAGLITALNLLERGIRPLILEKNVEIKSKPCGEAVGVRWLSELPFDSSPYIARKVKGARLIFPGGSIDHLDKESALLNRGEWLRGMAREITRRGGEIKLNSRVALDNSHLLLQDGAEISYDILIGADGPGSSLARSLGARHRCVVGCQYRVSADTAGMDYLEFHFDKRFSTAGAWVFPKDRLVNIGSVGSFAQLDALLSYRGFDKHRIVKKEAAIIPTSGIGRLVWGRISLIGDAAAMPTPVGLSGLAPIIQAARILTRHIERLEDYEREVRQHPIASPVLLRGAEILLGFSNPELVDIGKFFAATRPGEGHVPKIRRLLRHPALLPKLHKLRIAYQAGKTAMDYGW